MLLLVIYSQYVRLERVTLTSELCKENFMLHKHKVLHELMR